jgi:hypothetical protein
MFARQRSMKAPRAQRRSELQIPFVHRTLCSSARVCVNRVQPVSCLRYQCEFPPIQSGPQAVPPLPMERFHWGVATSNHQSRRLVAELVTSFPQSETALDNTYEHRAHARAPVALRRSSLLPAVRQLPIWSGCLTTRCSGLASLAAELRIVRPRREPFTC